MCKDSGDIWKVIETYEQDDSASGCGGVVPLFLNSTFGLETLRLTARILDLSLILCKAKCFASV